ncbi:ATP-binding cassette sub-family A member 5 isoform X4 [Strongylocentrotus purpuratus]|uniref:ABC transporter domain-containing protein n=1 Tax=Strongylocentrotus purpuratus TaxID=7668 RepID=A0A7M7PP13_STRPU|nr:ATP-binding cassette sub-family A member 5 isoform X4 [Strongylocentrotus purpuratus]
MSKFGNQLYWLLYRNFLFKLRFKQLTFQEIFISLIFVANLATLRYTTQTDPLPAIPSSSLKSHDLFDPRFAPSSLEFPIAFTPDTPEAERVVSGLASLLNVSASPGYVGYATEDEILNDVVNGTANISMALVFDDAFPSNLSYKIRLTYGAVTLNDGPYLGSGSPNCYSADPEYGLTYPYQCPANSYLYSGFSAIQAMVEHLIVKLVTGDSSLAMPDVSIRMFPKGQFDFSLDSLRITVSVYIVLAYMPFTAVLLTTLVIEKERKIKEVMKIMGLNNVTFWLSWIIVYIGIVFIVGLIIAGFSKAITLFPDGNFFLIFLGLFFYGLSVVTMSFMFSPLFKKATTAGGAGSFFIMLFVIPYIPLAILGPETVPAWLLWILCLFSPTAIAFFIDRCVLFEQISNGVQFSNLGDGYFPPYAPLVMIFVDIILYLLLAIYLENVVPGAYGQSLSPAFFLKPSYWRGSSDKGPNDHTGLLQDNNGSEHTATNDDALVEPVPAAMRGRNGIRIRNVKKIFRGKGGKPDVKAVNGISLDIYEGQITCLLGHNGAGKSTLMSCLTGMLGVTEGQATAYGADMFDPAGVEKIRSMTGVCLQENTLLDLLTPEEHLKFYAGLSGIPKAQIPDKVEEALDQIDLKNQRATFAKDLSGGQKRKLCVGIAIIGNPKILFLDEPSSGMDPYSRRKMWSLLKKQREGRVTLLTTHFMDEADILADRKAIISKGQLKCYGSSLFLKNKFGVGYRLGLVKESNCDQDKITDVIQTHIPEASITRSHGMELAYSLPLKDVSSFSGMFKSLEEKSADSSLGVQSYGVSMTTLEEVFLKIGEEAEIDEADAVPPSAVSGMTMEDSGSGAGASVTVNMEQSPLDSTIMATQPIMVQHNEQLKSLIRIEAVRAARNPATYVCRLILPIILMIVGGVLSLVITFGGDGPSDAPAPLVFTPSMYFSAPGASMDEKSTDLLYHNSLPNGQNIADLVAEFDNLNIESNATADLNALYDYRPHNGAFDVMDLGTTGSASQFTAYYNDTALHSLPVVLSIMSSALLNLYGNASVITAASHPFPKPAGTPEYTFTSGILFVYIFGLGAAWSLMGFPIDRVKERETKVKAQLRISGIDTLSYWGSVFVIDVAQMLLVIIIGLIIIFAMQVPSLTTGGAAFCLLVTVILWVPNAIVHTYCISFIFDKFETVQSYAFVIFVEIPLFLFLPTMFIDLYVSTAAAASFHLVMCVIWPGYAIFGSLYFIDKVYQLASIRGMADSVTFADYFAPEAYIWPTMLILVFDMFMLIFFLRFCEVVKAGGRVKDTCPCLVAKKIGVTTRNDDDIPDEDSDVKEERMKVEEMYESDQSSAVAISELRKEFVKRGDSKATTKVAVRNLSLTVQTGEVFGLLGPNGAGKTTTMNVVTADTEATNGQVRVGGYDVSSSLSDAYASMGYCPQIDPLWDDITMREHLEGFAGFKGIHPTDRRQIANNFMSAIGVMEHADKKAKELSGGTKRKLCFALSMLGNPKIVLLDEPSTGMDPSSKRFLWNVITSSFLEKKGAILTTHSMEEADAVCSRVGIMIQGQLRCLGTTQHLKDKYGGGYILEIKLNPGVQYYTSDQTTTAVMDILDEKMDILHKQVLSLIPQAEVTESFAERITYKIPRDSSITLSTVFAFLEQGKEDYGIEEYSFSQTTLEQVFIDFAKTQVDNPDEEAELVTVAAQENGSNRPGSRHSVRHAPTPQTSVNMEV